MEEYPECLRCKGTGMILARLTPEQDLGFAKRGMGIPKVECPTCNGDGYLTATHSTTSKPVR